MKLLWILFLILFDIAWKLAMIVAAFYLIVAVGMGIYWLLFETSAGLVLLGITVLVIIVKGAGSAGDDSPIVKRPSMARIVFQQAQFRRSVTPS